MREKLERIKEIVEEMLRSMDAGDAESLSSVPKDESEFAALKALLDSEEWPQAVFAVQMADENSEADKQERAEGICDIILPPLSGKRFLDFGCGEGHVASCMSRESFLSVGYEPERPSGSKFKWEEEDSKLLLTSDFERVRSMGPYDAVLLYDVLDHVRGDTPSGVLSKVSEVLSADGRVYMRCHPWCGRHGGHAYRKINKAFVHLVLTEEELGSMGVAMEYNNKVLKPLQDYSEAIKSSGLEQASEPEIDSQEVERFFRDNDIVRNRILRNWGLTSWGDSPPSFQMSQCFVDYVLKKK